MSPLTERVLYRHLVAKAKGQSLMPEYKVALEKLRQGDSEPAMKFAERLVDFILPGGLRPEWFTALSVQKMNAINTLYKEARVFSERGAGALERKETPEDRKRWTDYLAFQMEKWAKAIRTLELASVIADVESEIKHGQFTIIPIPGITKKQVTDALAALDEATGKIQQKFPKVLYGKVFLSKHLQKNVAAWYDAGTDTLALNVEAKKRFNDVYTICHELGHRHDFKLASKECKRKCWDLSTRKVYETVEFDEKLRVQMADEGVEMVKLKALGKPIPPMSQHFLMWLKSPHPHHKGDVRDLTTAYLKGKLDEDGLRAALKGKENAKLITGKILHGPLAVTSYGATKPGENYAEAFAHFVLGMDMPPEFAEIFAEESK